MFHSTDLSVCCYLPFPCHSLTLTTGQAFERSPNSSKESRANDDREGSSSYHCQNEWEKRRDSRWIRKGFMLLRWSEAHSNERQTSKYIDGSALWLMHCLCRSVQGKAWSPRFCRSSGNCARSHLPWPCWFRASYYHFSLIQRRALWHFLYKVIVLTIKHAVQCSKGLKNSVK